MSAKQCCSAAARYSKFALLFRTVLLFSAQVSTIKSELIHGADMHCYSEGPALLGSARDCYSVVLPDSVPAVVLDGAALLFTGRCGLVCGRQCAAPAVSECVSPAPMAVP